jgi:hypothetical protein
MGVDTSPEAIAALLEGVTPGPWRVEDGTTLIWGHCNQDDTTSRGMGYPVTECRITPVSSWARGPDADAGEANARFIAAARDLVPALAAEIARLTAERDEARAQVAMAYSRCLTLLRDVGLAGDHDNDPLSVMLREQCPADASTALAARDAAMRNEGRRQAAEIARSDAQSETGPILRRRLSGSGTPVAASARRRQAIRTARRILATLEPEGGE